MLFCDLVASTERRARLGDDRFDAFTDRFLRALRAAVDNAGGREVKSAGDGLMVVFESSVADAVACAIGMHVAMRGVDAEDPPLLRIGISAGEVAHDGDDYAGMPIVEAARLEAAAAPGQTLANAIVRTLVGSRGGYRFRDVGALTLKGIPDPLPAVEVLGDDVRDPLPDEPRPRNVRRWPVVGAAVLLVIVLAGLGLARVRSHSSPHAAASTGAVAPRNYVPQYREAPCPANVVQVAPEATCGILTVPEDRSKPTGKQVSLQVTRAPPRMPGPAVAPSIDVCGCEDAGNSVTRDHAELIHLALRGFSGSDPELMCPEVSAVRLATLAVRSDDPAQIDMATNALAGCYEQLVGQGVDPAQYNYVEAARDVLDLMAVLHITQADFTSYGTNDVIVFSIMRQAPAAVRSITLDNATAPGESTATDPIGDLAGAFGRFDATCNTDPVCARDYPDLAGVWRTSQQGAAANPPPVVNAPNPDDENAPPIPVLLDSRRNADALGAALDNTDTYALIPSVLQDPTATALAAGQALQAERADWDPTVPWGAMASFNCSYHVHTNDADATAQKARSLPEFVGDADSHWHTWCSAWKVPDVSGNCRPRWRVRCPPSCSAGTCRRPATAMASPRSCGGSRTVRARSSRRSAATSSPRDRRA